jgi:hypothetical protein
MGGLSVVRNLWLSAVAAILLIAAPTAYADMSASAPVAADGPQQAPAERGAVAVQPSAADGIAGGLGTLPVGLGAGLAVPTNDAAAPAKPLPSEPGTAGLFLSAFGSLGAWYIARATSKLHLFHVPDWYHAEGPSQIGHTFAANPDCGGMQVVCSFEVVKESSTFALITGRCDAPPVPQTLCLLTAESPRGPPLHS